MKNEGKRVVGGHRNGGGRGVRVCGEKRKKGQKRVRDIEKVWRAIKIKIVWKEEEWEGKENLKKLSATWHNGKFWLDNGNVFSKLPKNIS